MLFRRLTSLWSRAKTKTSPSAYWNQKYQTDEFIYTKVANRFVVELCEPLEPGSVIDIAAGEGRNAVWFAKRGWRAEAVDFSKVALVKCDSFAAEEGVADLVSTQVADATKFVGKLAPADLAVIAYLQIQQPLLFAALGNAIDNLRDGGRLVGVWHARENLDGGFGGLQNPEVLPSLESMKAFCERLPLVVEVCELREGQVQTKEGLKPSTTLILKARVRR
jgi:SAM-dependent methyltransferase